MRPRGARTVVRLVCLALAGVVVAEAAGRLLAPWYRRWGATDDEVARAWPGDDLTPGALSVTTRAVTIGALPAQVWPWLVQVGQDRGGFYSYTMLERLAGARMHNADEIVEAFQERKVGDSVWLAPPKRYGKIAEQVVAQLEPDRCMVLMGRTDWDRLDTGRTADGTWAFVLDRHGEQQTRLVMRSRYRKNRPLFDLVHFIMERGMMLGIKQRAERVSSNPTSTF